MPKDASVKEYMSANVVTFTPVMDIQQAINQLIKKGYPVRLWLTGPATWSVC